MNEASLGRRSRSGSVMVMVVVSMTALLGIAALVIDIGLLYVAKQKAQNTADACAVSGLAGKALFIVDSGLCGDEVKAKVTDEVTSLDTLLNGASIAVPTVKDKGTIAGEGAGLPISFDSTTWDDTNYENLGSLAVEVVCSIPVNLAFAPILDPTLKHQTVVGRAVALLSHPPDMTYRFAPWAVSSTVFAPHLINASPPAWVPAFEVDMVPPVSSLTLTNPGPGGKVNDYGFTAIALPGSALYSSQLSGSADPVELKSDFGHSREPDPYGNQVNILPDDTGVSGDTVTAMNARLADPDYATWLGNASGDSYPNSNRIVVVPVVDKSTREVKGFAPFFITGYTPRSALDPADVVGHVSCRLLSATWTGNRLRWGLKPRLSSKWLNLVSKIRLFDSRATLTD